MRPIVLQTGLDCLLDTPPPWFPGARVALLANQASLTADFRYAWEALHDRFPGQLVSLLSPQHGLWGEQQANMIESRHDQLEKLGIPVHSLYSDTRKPSAEMLADTDCVLVDLQDVGTRVYTFASTMIACMEACADLGMRVAVLDRPNPLGGTRAEGPPLDPDYASFVGRLPIPMRHGMTLGELARMARDQLVPGVELEVIPASGWKRRDMPWADGRRTWFAPSPNLPDFRSTLLYPGLVVLEGTNLSEGRGTTLPFQMTGAPYVDGGRLAAELGSLPGIRVLPVRFLPTFDKWAGQTCQGVRLVVTEHEAVSSYELGVRILSAVARLWPDEFQWLPPPYEYETRRLPIDIISGSAALRTAIDGCRGAGAPVECPQVLTPGEWVSASAEYKIYD